MLEISAAFRRIRHFATSIPYVAGDCLFYRLANFV